MHPAAEYNLPLDWADFDELPIALANHFHIQYQYDEFVLSFNQVTGPPLVGTPEEMREQAREHGHVPVHTLARFALTRHRLNEFIGLLQARLEEHDRAFGGQPV